MCFTGQVYGFIEHFCVVCCSILSFPQNNHFYKRAAFHCLSFDSSKQEINVAVVAKRFRMISKIAFCQNANHGRAKREKLLPDCRPFGNSVTELAGLRIINSLICGAYHSLWVHREPLVSNSPDPGFEHTMPDYSLPSTGLPFY